MTIESSTKTVVVLGGAYGGMGATASLAKYLPSDWRVVAIERNTHANHVYCFPRFTIRPEHAPKCFIPRSQVLTNGRVPPTPKDASPLPEVTGSTDHTLIQGIITKLETNSVTVLKANADGTYDDVKDDGSDAPADRFETIAFDYAVYALGAGLPPPSDVWGEQGKRAPGRGTKAGGMQWLADYGEEIKKAKSVLVVGGGALGIQFATDIKEVYAEKDVTLLHSRPRLLPIYHETMHEIVVARCAEIGVTTVLGERVMQWPEEPDTYDGKQKTVVTDKGTAIAAELVLVCTGTKPHVELMAELNHDAIAPNGCISVHPTMQVALKRSGGVDGVTQGVAQLGQDSLDNWFAVGDCADVECIRAGHNSFAMGAVAARNIVRLVHARDGHSDGHSDAHGQARLEKYVASEDRIKISLGMSKAVVGTRTEASTIDGRAEDLDAKAMWMIAGAQELGDDA